MATSLGELLDDIVDSAADAAPGRVVADDAQLALGELGSALRRLAFDGIGRSTSDGGTDPELSRWVDELAIACMFVGDAPAAGRSPGTSPGTSPGSSTGPGRLAQLAAAAGVTATLYQDELTGAERWATTVALTDAVLGLVRPAQVADASDPSSRLMVILEGAATVVSRFAAIDPPGLADSAILDRAVPDPSPVLRTIDDRISEAFAGLVHTTRAGTGPHSAATILAVCITAETVCRAAELGTETDRTRDDSVQAADAWAAVRTAMNPFDDGSRRQHDDRPPAVGHALALHRAVQQAFEASPDTSSTAASPAVTDVVTRLSLIAHHLSAAVVDAADGGRLFAYARDLPMREARVEQFLAGHRPAGVVRADALDVVAVTQSLRHAEDCSVTLADSVTAHHHGPSSGPVALQTKAWTVPAHDGPLGADSTLERSQQQREAASAHAASRSLQARQPTPTTRR